MSIELDAEDIGSEILSPLAKLDRDVKRSAGAIDRDQARNLVDMYYRMQGHRIDLAAQERALVSA